MPSMIIPAAPPLPPLDFSFMVTVSWSLCTEVLHWELYVLGRAGVPVCLKYVKGVGELYVMLRIIPPPFFYL